MISQFASAPLANEPAARLGEEGVGKQRMSELVTAVLWLGRGCCCSGYRFFVCFKPAVAALVGDGADWF